MNSSDADLLKQWQKGRDADAFAEIVSRHADMVFAACNRILRNPAEAEDAAQECFVTLMKARPAARHSLAPWLHTVARNRALDVARSNTRRRQREIAVASDGRVEEDRELFDIMAWTDEAIAGLPGSLRTPVVERFLAGKSHGVIAAELGITESTVRYRIGKGVERIRRALRAKGVPMTSAALTAMLGCRFAEAAPLALKSTLGKLAIAGQGATAAPALAAAGGLLLMKKVWISVIAVAGILLAGYWAVRPQPEEDYAREKRVERQPFVQDASVAHVEPGSAQQDELEPDAAPEVVLALADAGPLLQHCEIADPARYGTVSGHVRTEGGDAVAGAEVLLAAQGYEDGESFKITPEWANRALSRDHHFRATSGPDGTYRISGIRFRGEARVYAAVNRGDYAQGAARVVLREGEPAEGVDIAVRGSAMVMGHVVSLSGQPVADAVIRTVGADGGLAYTNRSGEFAIASGSPRTVKFAFCVHSPAHGDATFTEVAVESGKRVELKMPGAALLRGRVAWRDGKPAQGLTVLLEGGVVLGWSKRDDGAAEPGTTALDMRYEATIDDSGRYEITGIDPGEYYVKVSVIDGENRQYTEDVLGFLTPDTVSTWDAVLGGIGEVYGVILGEYTGEPMELGEQNVWALYDGRVVENQYLKNKAAYRLQLPARTEPYLICPSFDPFTHDGFEQYAREVRIAPGEQVELNLPFMERYSISIRVVDEGGAPVAGAEALRSQLHSSDHRAGETGEDGRFTCREMMPGFGDTEMLGSLVVRHPGHVEGRTQMYAGESGAMYPEEVVVLYRTASLTGRVVDHDGAPLGARTVDVAITYADERVRRLELHTNREGVFAADGTVPATNVAIEVTASPPGSEGQTWTFEPAVFAAGDTVDLGELVYDPPPAVAQ